MDSPQTDRGRYSVLVLAAILALATITRLYQFQGPMADNLQAKQIYIANKARSIARPPFNPLRNSLDFLDERGMRIVLTEEVPLYTGLLAFGYRLFGERDAVGHGLSLIGTLLAIGAFFDLARREQGERLARVATLLLASSPLLIFYGRAVLPDPWMLAGMLGSAAAYRRFLDGEGRAWLVTAALAGLMAAAFKYFGLMVLIPLADMARRKFGTRGILRPSFLSVGVAMVAPIAAWMVLVFLQGPNPVAEGWTGTTEDVRPYLIVQAPGVLLERGLWGSFFSRFLVRDCGPITTALIAVGVWTVSRRRLRAGPLASWTVMGLAFYVLLGPKLIDHDYYELMMLPAAAFWGAWGWEAIRRRSRNIVVPGRRAWVGPVLLAVLVVVQSPWVMGGMFDLEREKVALGEWLRRACPTDGRVVVMGPGIALATVVHYTGREGWAVRGRTLPADWRARFDAYRARGAEYVGLYFDPKAGAEQRASYRPLIEALTVVDRHAGPLTERGTRVESIVLRLGAAELVRRDGPRRK